MELLNCFKSIIDMDRASIVICNLEHEIIYLNPAAVRNYGKRGGKELIGKSLMNCHNQESGEKIRKVIRWFEESQDHNILFTFHYNLPNQ